MKYFLGLLLIADILVAILVANIISFILDISIELELKKRKQP